jgi:hypothetical protein
VNVKVVVERWAWVVAKAGGLPLYTAQELCWLKVDGIPDAGDAKPRVAHRFTGLFFILKSAFV